MTEAEWLACEDAVRLIGAVQKRGSQRKLRLMVAAAARLAWDRLPAGELREAVEACEARAEGAAGQGRLDGCRRGLYESYLLPESPPERRQWAEAPETGAVFALAFAATYPDATLRGLARNGFWLGGVAPHARGVCAIIRDIFGHPFRPVSFTPAWRTDTAVALARQMYESRDFGAMPILADALQEAGCDSEDILAHCRGPGTHVRGCWVLDLVLGKE
jgi:hypothetical protein